jgi:hypothetical protein
VFLGLPLDGSEPLIRPIITLCEEQGITVRVVAHLAALDWGKAAIDTLGEQPVITISSRPPDTLRLLAKRMIDIAGAGVGLFLSDPGGDRRSSTQGPIFHPGASAQSASLPRLQVPDDGRRRRTAASRSRAPERSRGSGLQD